jgi:hypothetical protein
MTTLVWDQVGERIFQSGVDRGVLYLHDGTAVSWNGLTGVEETPSSELKSFYLDGAKYLQNVIAGDFAGKLKAFTYPDEFDTVNGIASVAPGLSFYDQPAKSFNLSYRTGIGNDLADVEYGYKIHLLYNIFAIPENSSFNTSDDSGAQVTEFVWALSGTPEKYGGFRPTIHISIDSTKTPPDLLELLENTLYGTEVSDPSFPTLQEIADMFGYLGALIIIDHGDGTWSAVDESNTYITMLDTTTFQIDDADVTYLDADTYEISSTNVGS